MLPQRQLSPEGQVSGVCSYADWLADGSAETHVASLAVLPTTLQG